MQQSNRNFVVRSGVLTLVLAAWGNAAFAQAPTPASAPSLVAVQPNAATMSQQIETVEQILQLDSKMALEKAREKAGKAGPSVPAGPQISQAPVAEKEVIEVISILGSDPDKRATLAIDGKVHSRVGSGEMAGRYKVGRIAGGCVQLSLEGKRKKAKPAVQSVCFDRKSEAESQQEASMPPGVAGGAGVGRGVILPMPTIPAINPAPGMQTAPPQ